MPGANSAQIEAAKVGICATATRPRYMAAPPLAKSAGCWPRPKAMPAAPWTAAFWSRWQSWPQKSAPRAKFPAAFKPYFSTVPPCIKPSFLRYTNAKQQKRGVSHAGNIVPCSNYRNDRACPLGNAGMFWTASRMLCGTSGLAGRRLAAYLPYAAMSWISGSLTPMTLILWNRRAPPTFAESIHLPRSPPGPPPD